MAKFPVLAVLLSVGLVAPAVRGDEPGPVMARFVTRYCLDCHEGRESAAGLDLAALAGKPPGLEHFRRWVQVHDRLAAGTMPP
ncbi:MAG: hypothetical protein J5I93_19000, partial [Pirellulaceae bacterium]|nr:hypothetical protein [Pirellulaceae bacterium]